MNYAHPGFLKTPDQLVSAQLDPDLRLFDVTVFFQPQGASMTVNSGREAYELEHIPGAGFLDHRQDLSVADASSRFKLPPVETLVANLAAHGINDDTPVVLYSSGNVMWATRAWWLLRFCGHSDVSILDGGLAGWRAAGYKTSAGSRHYAGTTWNTQPRHHMFADIDQVAAATTSGSHCTVNALSRSMYDGTSKVTYGRPGHIPNSINLPYAQLLQKEIKAGVEIETFADPQTLHSTLEAAGLLGTQPVITYCGGGTAATVNGFACALMGKDEVAVYDGSMIEWGGDPSRPVVT